MDPNVDYFCITHIEGVPLVVPFEDAVFYFHALCHTYPDGTTVSVFEDNASLPGNDCIHFWLPIVSCHRHHGLYLCIRCCVFAEYSCRGHGIH